MRPLEQYEAGIQVVCDDKRKVGVIPNDDARRQRDRSDWSRSGGESSGIDAIFGSSSGGGRAFPGRRSNLPAWMAPGAAAAAQVATTGEGPPSQTEHQKGSASDEGHPRQHMASSDPAPLPELTSGAPVELTSLATGNDRSAAGRCEGAADGAGSDDGSSGRRGSGSDSGSGGGGSGGCWRRCWRWR